MVCRNKSPPFDLNSKFRLNGGQTLKKQPKIWLDGKLIDVPENVYKAYVKGERKHRYFSKDLKVERIIVNQKEE